MLVSPGAMLNYWTHNVTASDPALSAAAQKLCKLEMRFWDVGANVRIFALAAQVPVGAAGHVLAMEADLWLESLLQRSRTTRGKAGEFLDLLSAPLSDNVRHASFGMAACGLGSSTFEKNRHRRRGRSGLRFSRILVGRAQR